MSFAGEQPALRGFFRSLPSSLVPQVRCWVVLRISPPLSSIPNANHPSGTFQQTKCCLSDACCAQVHGAGLQSEVGKNPSHGRFASAPFTVSSS